MTDTEAGKPTLWDNAWREGHAHGLAKGLGISYHDGFRRTMAMLAGKPLDLTGPGDENPETETPRTSRASQQNKRGEWVPAIPLPLYGPRKRCRCGRKFWTIAGYRGHYALAHILGTP
ncbi:MAG TPA: hypothetical protein VIX86_11650 [Streptosporangiaceae bacterium]